MSCRAGDESYYKQRVQQQTLPLRLHAYAFGSDLRSSRIQIQTDCEGEQTLNAFEHTFTYIYNAQYLIAHQFSLLHRYLQFVLEHQCAWFVDAKQDPGGTFAMFCHLCMCTLFGQSRADWYKHINMCKLVWKQPATPTYFQLKLNPEICIAHLLRGFNKFVGVYAKYITLLHKYHSLFLNACCFCRLQYVIVCL